MRSSFMARVGGRIRDDFAWAGCARLHLPVHGLEVAHGRDSRRRDGGQQRQSTNHLSAREMALLRRRSGSSHAETIIPEWLSGIVTWSRACGRTVSSTHGPSLGAGSRTHAADAEAHRRRSRLELGLRHRRHAIRRARPTKIGRIRARYWRGAQPPTECCEHDPAGGLRAAGKLRHQSPDCVPPDARAEPTVAMNRASRAAIVRAKRSG
jgi:hypothetical protein